MKERLTFPSDGEQGLEISCNFAGVKYDEQMENQSITKIQVRPLQIEDYGQLAQSFRRVYSDGSDVFWTHEQIETLLRIFPEGQVVTVADDKIIGCALSIIVDYDLVKGEHTLRLREMRRSARIIPRGISSTASRCSSIPTTVACAWHAVCMSTARSCAKS